MKCNYIIYEYVTGNIESIRHSNGFLVGAGISMDAPSNLPNTFLQVHKSYIITISNITLVKSNSVFIDSIEIPVGRTYKMELEAKLNSTF